MENAYRFLIVVWEFPPGPGGIGQHAFSLAYALNSKGHGVKVITSADYAGSERITAFDRLYRPLHIVRVSGGRIMKLFRRFLAVFHGVVKYKPDLVILSGKSALWFALPISLILPGKSKLIAFLHGSEVRLSGGLGRQLTYLSIRSVWKTVCVSSFTRSLLPENIRGKASIEVLPNGLNLDLMPAKTPVGLPALSGKGFPRLLTVGRISRRKGQHRVVKALPHLLKKWPEIHYHMVGLDEGRDEIIALASAMGVEDHISIHGPFEHRDSVYSAFGSADVFVMLSENQPNGDVEGFGIAILEANYFGLPAIGARDCGIEDAIEDGVNGYLVNGDDPAEIEEALVKCVDNASLNSDARNWARRHDWNILIDRLLSAR